MSTKERGILSSSILMCSLHSSDLCKHSDMLCALLSPQNCYYDSTVQTIHSAVK